MNVQPVAKTVAEDFLRILGELGVENLFANAGTDFPPLIEAYARCRAGNARVPAPVTVPHENVAVGLAMGAYLASGRPQAVMVHVNVGTANALCGLMNAFRGNVPVLLFAGRTPFTESGRIAGARSSENHWSQEMFDQGGLVRESVKWDFELADPDVLATALERVWSIATSDPKGPVYLTLPREVLAAPAAERHGPVAPASTVQYEPDAAAVGKAAEMLRAARNPLMISTNGGRTAADFAALTRFAETFAIPVTQRKPRFMAIPTDHPMHRGYDPDALLADADLVLAIDCDAPWVPSRLAPRPDCGILSIGPDPLFQSYPLRGFRCDTALAGSVEAVLDRLAAALDPGDPDWAPTLDARRERIAGAHAAQRKNWRADLEACRGSTPIDPVWASHCVDRIKGDDGIVVRELPLTMSQMQFREPGCYFSPNWAAGLGCGLGTALGVKLMQRERLVICVVGDGSYMFGTPLAAHYVAAAEDLPILTIIFNNERWDAVRRSTRAMYPDGAVSAGGTEAFTSFRSGMQYERVVEAAGGYGVGVTDPEELPGAIEHAALVVRQGRQAVVNIVCA